MVNQSDHLPIDVMSERRAMSTLMSKVASTLSNVLDNEHGAIEDKDRISLIKYGRNLRRIFTLVEKEKNFVQLKNQVEYLRADVDECETTFLAKALRATMVEFTRGSSYQSMTSGISNYDSNLSVSGASVRQSPSSLADASVVGQFNYHSTESSFNKRWVVCFTNQV